MNRNKFWAAMGKALAVVAVILVAILLLATSAKAVATEKVLYSFTGGADGSSPRHSLIFDTSGNLYGTTFWGGDYGAGTVFRLTPKSDGSWTEDVLYHFTGGSDGGYPDWGSLTFDAAGNLYGVTYGGGNYGVGTVFELTPNGDGSWSERVLHQFTWGDGGQPRTKPIFDALGNFYGAAAEGGAYGCGVVFKMTPGSNNNWTYHVIHNFRDKPACHPWVGLIADKAGNLYGTTRNTPGGCTTYRQECGTVFKMTPTSGGKWTYKVIHQFTGGKGGSDPGFGLVFDEAGTLYGITWYGGDFLAGVVYKLTPGVGDKWVYRVIHHFKGPRDGMDPWGVLARDAVGNLYGSTGYGGPYGGGTVFKLAPSSDGSWTFSVLHSFGGEADNLLPGPILDAAGNLYGISVFGGDYGAGMVYEITP